MSRVLVVDDERDVVTFLVEELRFAGFEAEGAGDGVEAVLKVLDGGWDAVLMDFRMPRLDGANALKIIRRVDPGLTVIMFTGQAGQGDMMEAMRLGAYTCLLKPVKVEALLSLLNQATERRKGALPPAARDAG